MPNALARATSPYLLQHRDNPVDWREWGSDALAEARARDVPVLLSVGYAACHWCHVMAHESFEDPAVAALMNERFVSIKVDREERPDLDAIYQGALAVTGQQGGWPLTMFLTPAGEPFWGGTYFPPEPRYGRPSFPQVLEQISSLWRGGREKIEGNRAQLLGALRRMSRPEGGGGDGGGELDAGLAIRAARLIARAFDATHGGLGGAPKFPQAPILSFLWRAALAAGDRTVEARVLHTLRRICQGGIYDHLGGGFARYSVDAFWLVPHFEKMLYDNAQLLRLLGEAWAATRDPLFLARAEETVGWLEREMLVEGGAFASALDADSEGEEGKFYVWDESQIDAALGGAAAAAAFKLAYGVTGGGNFEERNVLNRLHEPGLPEPAEEAALARARATLLEARAGRVRPGLDDKVLADWNGLMIAGLAEAAFRFDRPAWLETAARAFAAVTARMAEGDRLFHSWREGRRLELAFLDDYAQMAAAALALFEGTGEGAYLARAEAWLGTADREFRDGADGSYFQTSSAADPLIVRPRSGHDGPSPAAVGTLAEASVRLFLHTGDDRHRVRAEGILRAFAGEAARSPAGYGTLLGAALAMADPLQLVIAGPRGAEATRALLRAAAGTPVPFLTLRTVEDPARLPAGHPAAGKGLVGGAPAAYICRGPVCQAPVTDPEGLRARLRDAGRLGAG